MKKVIILVVALTLVMGGIAFAKVSGSKHDMTTVVTDPAGNQVCVYCHHPHKGESLGQNALLWNINDATATYTLYKGTATTSFGDVGDASAPQSLLCMGCHDGDVTQNTFIQGSVENDFSGPIGLTYVNDAANLGSSLEGDHPIGFDYPTADVANATSADLKLAEAGGAEVVTTNNTYPLYNGKMECATCHNVHAGVPDGSDSKDTDIQFMRGSMDASEMCVDCHVLK